MNSPGIKNFIAELRRRRLLNSVALYVVGAWAALQVAELALPALEIPEVAIRYVWIAAIAIFPIALLFSWLYDISTTGIRRTPPPNASPEEYALHKSDKYLITILLLITVAIITDMAFRIGRHETLAPSALENSIAVLPFDVCEGQENEQFLAHSVAHEVITKLAERGRLKVRGRVSSFAFAGIGLPVTEIIEPLGVEYLLTGTFCLVDTIPTLEVELLDSEGFVIWRGEFKEEINEFDQVTQQLATLAANAVAAELGDVFVIAKDKPVNRAAYTQLLIAREHRASGDNDSAQKAAEKALEYEPGYAEAKLFLAFLASSGPNRYQDVDNILDAWTLGKEALDLAEARLKVNPDSFDAHLTKADILYAVVRWKKELTWYEAPGDEELNVRHEEMFRRLAEIEHHYRSAISINPTSIDAYVGLAWVIEQQGIERWQEALEIYERALEIEPYHPFLVRTVAKRWINLGRQYQAFELFDSFWKIPKQIPKLIWLKRLDEQMLIGHLDEMCKTLIMLLTTEPEHLEDAQVRLMVQRFYVRMLWVLGMKEEAAAWHERIEYLDVDELDWAKRYQKGVMGTYKRETQHPDWRQFLGRDIAGLSDEDILKRGSEFTFNAAYTLWGLGEYDRATRLMESHKHSPKSTTYFYGNNYHEWAQLQRASLAGFYRAIGRTSDANELFQSIIDVLEVDYQHGIRNPTVLDFLAYAYAGLGRDNEALDMLEKAVDYHFRERWPKPDERLEYLNNAPKILAWKHLEDHPRFIAQRERMQADIDLQAKRIRAMLAEHDLDELLKPVMKYVKKPEEVTQNDKGDP